MSRPLRARITRINAQIWLVLSVFIISVIFNAGIAPHHLLIGLYLLPTLFAAFYGGRRYALFTAAVTVVLVYGITHAHPARFAPAVGSVRTEVDVLAWAGMLLLTAYILGTLADQKKQYVRELRETYHGVLLILSHFVSQDSYTQTHSHRVSLYATEIAASLNMSEDEIEDVRAAALLHDIGKLQVSRELLYKAARLTDQEYQEMMQHVERGAEMLSHVGGSLRRVIPIVLAHHEKFDGTGQNQVSGNRIPLGARVIAVADVYDALISDRPYRKALAPFEAKDAIQKGSGTEFDPEVVAAFVRAFQKGRLEAAELA
jgi:putative nucleotidyltransferase with HDIG domain